MTIDHDEIRRWVEERGGKPAVVKRTTAGRKPGILRVDFPGFSGQQSLAELEWDEWFERFDSANLAFLHQDETGAGKTSRFNKLVAREGVEMSDAKRPARRSSAAARGGRRRTPAGTARTKRAVAPRGRASQRGAKSGSSASRRGRSTGSPRAQGGKARGTSGTQRREASSSSGTRRRKAGGSSRPPSRTQRAPKRGSKRRAQARRRGRPASVTKAK